MWNKAVWALGLVLLGGSFAAPGVQAGPEDVEGRLKRLEKAVQGLTGRLVQEQQKNRGLEARLEALRSEIAAGTSPKSRRAFQSELKAHFDDLVLADSGSPLRPPAGKGGTVLERTHVGGYFDLEFHSNGRGSNDSNFDQHRFIINISSQINERLRFYSELEVEGGAEQSGTKTIMPSIGNSFNNRGGGGELSLEQAYLDLTFAEWLVLRAGAMLVPMGQLNQHHDSDIREFTERPLPDSLIVPTTWTDTGFGFHGVVDQDDWTCLPSGTSLNYQVYVFNGLRAGDGRADSEAEDRAEVAAVIGDKGLRDARPGFRDDNNSNKAIAGRVGVDYSPVGEDGVLARFASGTQLGVSIYNGALDDAESVDLTMVGFDLRTRFGEFFEKTLGLGPGPNGTPRVEYLMELYRVFLDGGNDGRGGIPDGLYGWYGETRYRFMPEAVRRMLAKDMRKTALFTALVRYAHVDLDTGITSSGDRGRLEFGLNFRPYPNLVFKSEYQMNNARGGRGLGDDEFIFSVAVGF